MSRHIAIGTLWTLPSWSQAPRGLASKLEALAGFGVEAVQHHDPDFTACHPLSVTGMARIDAATDADAIASSHKQAGLIATTLHVGTGLETDDEMDRLISSIVEASTRHDYPLFVETHRATVTQDMRRTLDLIDRIPEVRFNADLSHWYTGQEITYGDIQRKFDLLSPVFDRVRYIHGRIGTPCCAQVCLHASDDDRPFVEHFKEMWRMCCRAFMRTAVPGEILPFAPELLPYSVRTPDGEHLLYYARRIGMPDHEEEESDRWVQAQILWDIAEDCAQEVGLEVRRRENRNSISNVETGPFK